MVQNEIDGLTSRIAEVGRNMAAARKKLWDLQHNNIQLLSLKASVEVKWTLCVTSTDLPDSFEGLLEPVEVPAGHAVQMSSSCGSQTHLVGQTQFPEENSNAVAPCGKPDSQQLADNKQFHLRCVTSTTCVRTEILCSTSCQALY